MNFDAISIYAIVTIIGEILFFVSVPVLLLMIALYCKKILKQLEK